MKFVIRPWQEQVRDLFIAVFVPYPLAGVALVGLYAWAIFTDPSTRSGVLFVALIVQLVQWQARTAARVDELEKRF